jgi:alpha-glucosidase
MLDAEQIQLPAGNWYDFWTYSRHTDAEKIKLLPKLDELPVYVRAGTILPMQPVTVSPKEIRRGDESIKDWHYDESTHSVTALVPNSLSDWTVNLATP